MTHNRGGLRCKKTETPNPQEVNGRLHLIRLQSQMFEGDSRRVEYHKDDDRCRHNCTSLSSGLAPSRVCVSSSNEIVLEIHHENSIEQVKCFI
jgi:hypothetical protein